MTPDNIQTIITAIPIIGVLCWVIVRQDARIDLLLKNNADLIERFIPPQADETTPPKN